MPTRMLVPHGERLLTASVRETKFGIISPQALASDNGASMHSLRSQEEATSSAVCAVEKYGEDDSLETIFTDICHANAVNTATRRNRSFSIPCHLRGGALSRPTCSSSPTPTGALVTDRPRRRRRRRAEEEGGRRGRRTEEEEEEEEGGRGRGEEMRWYLVAALLTLLTSSQGILTTLSQSHGKYKYDYATVPFLAEVFKVLSEEEVVNPTVDGDCSINCWDNYKPGALLFWRSIIPQVKGCGEASCDSLFSAPIQGYMFGLLSACLSALAGVYTEYLMKKNNDTLYWQNVQLYTYIALSAVSFGAIFNMARLMMDDFRVGLENGPWWQRLLNGYTVTTWLVVLNLGSSGLLVSWLMKYADNIVKASPGYLLSSMNVEDSQYRLHGRSQKVIRITCDGWIIRHVYSSRDGAWIIDVRPKSDATVARELKLRDDPHPATATCLCWLEKNRSRAVGLEEPSERSKATGEIWGGGGERESIDSVSRVRRRLPETMHHAFVGRPASAEVSATPSRTRLRGTDGRSFQQSSMNTGVRFVGAWWPCNRQVAIHLDIITCGGSSKDSGCGGT
ncbi:hypothetical protein MUK42_34436 [Musa troglodytarum]|uniref:Uncharacterized protein n=1 Tax=Musa troglodytarum TaxID=320322 RepID=A0A9E7HUF8_9LILI|nr:hypothetical protein MUK42_34436 [Musa troglodytarum]